MILSRIGRVVVPTSASLSLTLDVLKVTGNPKTVLPDDKELLVIRSSCLREAGTIKDAFGCIASERLSDRRSQESRIPLLPTPHVRY